MAAPVISGDANFDSSTEVTITGPEGATIYYTTDGSVPTESSSVYATALTITATTTVKAIAVKDGVSSSVASSTFTLGEGGGDSGGGGGGQSQDE